MLKARHRRIRLLPTAVLASTAIAGLLMMHGLEAATIGLTTDASVSHQHDGPATDLHGTLGICVFVISVLSLGTAVGRTARQRHRFTPACPATVTSVRGPGWSPPAGRSLFLDLGVLRL